MDEIQDFSEGFASNKAGIKYTILQTIKMRIKQAYFPVS